jgi:hypothetical protein
MTNTGTSPHFGQSQTAGLGSVVRVSAGGLQSLCLRRDGTVKAWGNTTPADGIWGIADVAAGDSHLVALSQIGFPSVWGSNPAAQASIPYECREIVAVSAGDGYVLTLRADGTVVAWGTNSLGQLQIPPGLTNVVAISAGGAHGLALRRDGTVVGWGDSSAGQATPPAGLSNIVEIAAGGQHSLARRADGRVFAWGSNAQGQRDVPATVTNAVRIAAGGQHSLAFCQTDPVPGWMQGNVFEGWVGQPLDLSAAAQGNPTNYEALFLPPSLALNPVTGAISGTPTEAGCFNSLIAARNSAGVSWHSVTFLIRSLTIEKWRASRFSAAQLGQPLISGDSADPDEDGCINALEYALGRNPLLAETEPPLQMELHSTALGLCSRLSYANPIGLSDVMLIPEVSQDLKTWSSAVGTYRWIETTTNGVLRKTTLESGQPMAKPAEFVRLRAEFAAPGSAVVSQAVPLSTENQTIQVNDKLRISVPGGTLAQPQTLTVSGATQAQMPDSSALLNLGAYDIRLGDQHEFSKPLTIELGYDPATLRTDCRPQSAFLVAYWDEQILKWVPMPFTVDTTRHQIILQTSHLTIIGWWMWAGGYGVYDAISPFVLIYNPADFPAGVSYNTEASFNTPRTYSITLGASAPVYVSEAADFLARAYDFYLFESGLTVLEGPFNVIVGFSLLDSAYEKFTGITLINLNNLGRKQMALVTAHELFHQAVQPSYYNPLSLSRAGLRTWWIEATAEYAAAKIAWKMADIVSARDPQNEFLKYALNRRDNTHEYDAGEFIDFLVRQGVKFPGLFQAIAGTAKPFVVLQPLNEYLLAAHRTSLADYYHLFAGDFLFNPTGYLVGIDPAELPFSDDQYTFTPSQLKTELSFLIDGDYSAKVWSLRIQANAEFPKRKFRFRANQWPDPSAGVRADIYLLKKNERQAGILPVAYLQAITDTQEVEAEATDVIYVVTINSGGASALPVTIEATDITPRSDRTVESVLSYSYPNALTRSAKLGITHTLTTTIPTNIYAFVKTNTDSWGTPISADLSVYRLNQPFPVDIDLSTTFMLTLRALTNNTQVEIPSDGNSSWATGIDIETRAETTISNPRILIGTTPTSITSIPIESRISVPAGQDFTATVYLAFDYTQAIYKLGGNQTWYLDTASSKLETTQWAIKLLYVNVTK